MEESSRESQPRCPCGFWGSPNTLGLCSVCYRKALRNQNQESSNTADAGRTAVVTCHSQSQTSQGKRMDSKHFPSRPTADNLPSSLSSPPGERTALSAAPTSSVDAAAPTANGVSAAASHLSTSMSSGGVDVAQAETATMTLPSSESLLSSDESDLHSTTSSSVSYDTRRDTSSHSSDSYASLASVSTSSSASVTSSNASSIASVTATESGEEFIITDYQVAGSQSSVTGGTLKDDIASNSSTQSSSDAAKTLSTCVDTTVVNNLVASSSKNSAANSLDKGEKQIDTSIPCDISSQASTSGNNTLANACRNSEQAPGEANISSSPPRGTKRSRDEMEDNSEEVPTPSPQMNKRRCFACSCKLELAQRTIGLCRCDRVFCALHRLPESHECEFDHKEDGRREAREKMVKPARHLGPSYRREDPS